MAKETAPSGGSRPAVKAKAPAPATAARRGASPVRPGGATTDKLSRRVNAPSITTFFEESRAELRKVTWPTRQETLNLTGAVIVMTVGLAAFLGVIDALLDAVVKPLIGAK